MEITPEQARCFMVGHHRLTGFHYAADTAGLSALLRDLRCIQLDPLQPLGTSPDLVAQARCHDYRMGDLFRLLMPGAAFEHYAKERCLLPRTAYPYYRSYAVDAMWARLGSWYHKSMLKVPLQVQQAVLAELAERGPLTPSQMADHGAVVPSDWSGWKGTAKATTLALELLWARCEAVVCGRNGREKLYDVPERALGLRSDAGQPDFARWALLERVEAAGLLPLNMGPHWSMIEDVRAGLPEQLVEERLLEEVTVAGFKGRFLAPVDFLARTYPACDDALRILGPLDPLLWYRPLVQHIFGFEYIWEVYKPADQRRWGWYVCPLLHRGQFVGRLEGHVEDRRLVIDTVWREQGRELEKAALEAALKRHVEALGCRRFTLPKRFK